MNRLVLSIFALLLFKIGNSQVINLRNYSVEEGLSENSVFCIFQDSEGFMWFGTKDGLNRFDGRQFKVFRATSGDSTAIPKSTIRYITEDYNKQLWLGTANKGVYLYDMKTQSFSPFRAEKYEERLYAIDSTVFEKPHKIPGTVAAAQFRNGGEGVGYHDSTQEAIGYDYRPNSSDNRKLSSGDIVVAWNTTGEWYKYDVEVEHTGDYSIEIQYTHLFPDKKVQLFMDDDDLATVTLPPTQTWDKLGTRSVKQVHLEKGKHTLTCKTVEGDVDLHSFTFRYLDDPSKNEGNPNFKIDWYENNIVKLNKEANVEPSFGRVNTLLKDSLGHIWIGATKGLFRYNAKTKTLLRYSDVPLSDIGFIAPSKNGGFWTANTWNGVSKYDPESDSFTHTLYDAGTGLSPDWYNYLYEDSKGDLWFSGPAQGLQYFDRQAGKVTHYKPNGDSTGISQLLTRSVLEIGPNQMLIGTEIGLNILNTKTQKFTQYYHDVSNPKGLSDNTIYSLFMDREEGLWIGTYFGGVNYLPPVLKPIEHYYPTAKAGSLRGKAVSQMCEDSKGNLWICTENGGLNYFNTQNKTFTNYYSEHPDPKRRISFNNVHSVETYNGKVYVGTFTGGMDVIDEKSGEIKNYLPGTYIDDIYIDSKGNIWVGGYLFLRHFYPKSGTFSENLLKGVSGYCMYEDSFGNFWVSLYDQGLRKYNYETNTWNEYHYDEKHPATDGLRSNSIISIHQDSKKRLWFGSNGDGLFEYSYENDSFTQYSTQEKLPNSVVYGILDDKEGNLWISTNAGICYYDPQKQEAHLYQKNDGLQSNQFNFQSFLKTRDGKMYFGGINGFNAFYPDSLKENRYSPAPILTGFQLFNKEVPIGENSILQQSITYTDEIVLNYDQSVFSFDFVSLSFFASEQNSYRYKMENFDENWREVGNTTKATYTNLMEGEYIFRVQSANHDDVWSSGEVALRIKILPPVWRTLWFRVLVVAVVIWLLISVYIVRVRRLKRQKAVLEKTVLERTQDLQEANVSLEERQEEIIHQNEEILSINEKLDGQNKELARKNEYITSSIRYAKTIQQAILPLKENMNRLFRNFVIYRPKDVVSGDFYWFMHQNQGQQDEKAIVIVSDCTGHGVPGAFMSMIGASFLDEIIRVKGITSPAIILTELDARIRKALKQEKTENNDGMDMSVCLFEKKGNNWQLTFEAAKSSIVYFDNHKKELKRTKGTTRKIGGHFISRGLQEFRDKSFTLHTGDILYLLSDGFVDQNNTDRKRFGTNRLMEKLNQICTTPIGTQKEALEAVLDEFQGESKQRDDITLIGLEIE